MKKLILSAVFALACFTAQAENEVIKNDDKNPKNKGKVTKVNVKITPFVVSGEVICSDGEPMTITAWGTSYGEAVSNYWSAFFNVALGC